ncbi:hypothetical protein ABLO16_02980, partial [Mycobacterium tuberculosis]
FRSVIKFGCLTLNQEGKARCFRIYRETLSRFRAPLHWRSYATQHLWTTLEHPVNQWPPQEKIA